MKEFIVTVGLLMAATSQLAATTKFQLSADCAGHPNADAKIGITGAPLSRYLTLDCNNLEISINPFHTSNNYAILGSLDGNIAHECNPPLINQSLEDGVTYIISVTPEDKPKPSPKCTINIAKD